MHNLATTMCQLGEHGAARSLQERVMELWLGSLRERHPVTLAAMHNLAVTLSAQGELEAARGLEGSYRQDLWKLPLTPA